MAIDNLNYMSSWMPAWQQTDKYSSQPWCLKSKNLDIFSSSKSVKATAFSEPVAWEGWVVKEEWWLVLKTDGKVYERTALGDTLFIDPSVNFPVYKVSYTWSKWPYADAIRWTPQDMSVITEWDVRKSFVVFTDRASFTYSKVKYVLNKSFTLNRFTEVSWIYDDGYAFRKTVNTISSWYVGIVLENPTMSSFPIKIKALENENNDATVSLSSITVRKCKYYYDWELDAMDIVNDGTFTVPFSWDITQGINVTIPSSPYDYTYAVSLNFDFVKKEWSSTYGWEYGLLYIDINWWPIENHLMMIGWVESDGDSNYFYSYLPLRDRKLKSIWVYWYSESYWMKWVAFQPLYKRVSSWAWIWGDKKLRYDFVKDMWWNNDPWMDVIWMIVWNEQIYMIWNLDWNWYIIPCDLTWWVGTPYIAYWCTFLGVTNIDYLLYLVWEDRWISTLWVFNQQELVPVIWGNKENTATDLVWVDEQYKFDWKIVNWRKNLILTTKDNRIFQYWQTYGGKWWAFIHELPANAVITSLKANWNDLEINYSITVNDTTTNYSIKYQDDTPMKRYNTEWSATYPIVLGNHILEKEESDLYTSFILPSASTKLEFWGMANHYHFWTFTSEDNATLSESESYKIKGTSWTYALKFIERNDNQYTFRLEWDLPVQTSSEMKITDSNNTVVLNYTDFNHFRKIWTIETDKYLEWEFRFHNLNNKLELPKSHSLQIMVKGKGTTNYTPELFSLDLIANQRERW